MSDALDPAIVQRCVLAYARRKHRGAAETLRTLKRYGSLRKWKVRP